MRLLIAARRTVLIDLTLWQPIEDEPDEEPERDLPPVYGCGFTSETRYQDEVYRSDLDY